MSDLIERLRRLYVQQGTNYVQEAADEIERLTAALHAQPGPVSLDDVEWAGKVHLAEAIRERDELRRQLAECSQMLARQAATIARMPAGPRG